MASQLRNLRLTAAALLLIFSSTLPSPVAAESAGQTAGLIGKTAGLCGITSAFSIQVTNADWQKTLLGVDAAGMWVVVIADVTNTGERPDIPFGLLDLRDEQGRVFSQFVGDDAARFAVELPPTYGVTTGHILQPGSSGQALWVYDVAPDVGSLDLAPNPLFCK